jgi:hypothetical protein
MTSVFFVIENNSRDEKRCGTGWAEGGQTSLTWSTSGSSSFFTLVVVDTQGSIPQQICSCTLSVSPNLNNKHNKNKLSKI